MASAASLAVLASATATLLPTLTSFATTFANSAIADTKIAGPVVTDRIMWVSFSARSFVMRPADYPTLIWWIAGTIVAGMLVARLLFVGMNMRFFIILNLIVICASAIFIMMNGRAGYQADEFTRLYWRTAVLIWLLMPVLIGTVVLVFPFTPIERIVIVILTLGYDVVLSALRFVVFACLLGWLGPVLMTLLYLLYGPLLDFIAVSGLFTFALVRLSRRITKETRAWSWL